MQKHLKKSIAYLFITSLSLNIAFSQVQYETPLAATNDLVNALIANKAADLATILGPEAQEVLYSGDEAADAQARTAILSKIQQRINISALSPEQAFISIGEEDWPVPIPLIKNKDAKWQFDLASAKQEIFNRRIGSNELYVLMLANAFVQAQEEYKNRPESNNSYAQQFVSTPGTTDGLYWEDEEQSSPFSDVILNALEEGYTLDHQGNYHGYTFKILTQQGEHAPGGKLDYNVNGQLEKGVALLAYPMEYKKTGVMSFIVDQSGVVYEKDLGKNTSEKAKTIISFNPDQSWKLVEPLEGL